MRHSVHRLTAYATKKTPDRARVANVSLILNFTINNFENH